MKRFINFARRWRKRLRQLPWSKHNVRRIKGIEPAEIDCLRGAKLADQELLQESLDTAPGAVFAKLAHATRIGKVRLLALLQASLNLWAKPPWIRRVWHHWADLAVVAVIILLGVEWFHLSARPVQMIAKREIAPFQQIQRSDLEESLSPDGRSDAAAKYTGKYTISRVAKGSALSAAELAPELGSLRLEIKNGVGQPNLSLPQTVDIVLSSRQPPPGGVVIPAVLLKLEPSGNTFIATLKIASKDRSEAAKWVGGADAYLVLRGPDEPR